MIFSKAKPKLRESLMTDFIQRFTSFQSTNILAKIV